ncbi:MAG TPA: hypothetical protein VHW01_14065 [Polyangiaceae bacterium]|nr:hypothetical protein [Polyangiaceae bacterium]
MKKLTGLLAVVALGAGIALVGCGSDDDSSGPTAGTGGKSTAGAGGKSTGGGGATSAEAGANEGGMAGATVIETAAGAAGTPPTEAGAGGA